MGAAREQQERVKAKAEQGCERTSRTKPPPTFALNNKEEIDESHDENGEGHDLVKEEKHTSKSADASG